MNINRKISPVISELSVLTLLSYTRETFANGTEVICVHDPNQEVFKMDITFDAGAFYQPQPLTASTTINMLNEGTRRHSSSEIAEIFDYYGAYTDFNSGMHKAEVNLFSMNKFAEETIPVVAELITESTIPANELEIYLRNKLQQFRTENQKTAWLARKEMYRLMFGTRHPYGNRISEQDYTRITPELIRQFYAARILSGKSRIILSGNITETIRKRIQESFATLNRPVNDLPKPEYVFEPAKPGRYHTEKADAVQTSIRIGKKGVGLTDKDYAGFLLLNTVLGGYFGSRLMSNIREEKGYTYGIQSFNISLPLTAYWGISTDVDNKYTQATIDEILKEIEKIRQEPIPSDELNRVKSFFYGDLLREIDGVFSQADSLKQKLIYDKDNRFYIEIIDRVKHCTPDELQELAQRYLDPAELYIVTAGKTI